MHHHESVGGSFVDYYTDWSCFPLSNCCDNSPLILFYFLFGLFRMTERLNSGLGLVMYHLEFEQGHIHPR